MHKKIIFIVALFTSFLQAQHIDPLLTEDAEAQKIWVDSILNSMSIDEKIGQFFMVQAYSNKDEKHEQEITEMIEKYHVGNLIFMQGTPEKQVVLNNKYQALSKVPLLIGFDGEWGLDMRLQNTYRFPWNMTLGAIQDNQFIEKFGEHVGKHCKRLGIHVNFAPVVDINTNPKNPIIGNRSFGENKENVTQKAIAFIQGIQRQQVLANAKHFPGHGDTATDSHHTLPTLNFDVQRLDSVELYPYKRVFDARVTSVMTAHLSIPSLEPNKTIPTSLSKKVVTDLLQKKLGFLGLIFTDGLNMKGAANYATSAAIDVAAIIAGNDILLIPQDVPATIAEIKKALQFGELNEDRINHSVRKILKAKYWAGLHHYQPISTENIDSDLNKVEDEILHRKLIEQSLTLIKNSPQNIPVRNLDKQKIAYVQLGDAPKDAFLNMLKNYTSISEVSDKNLSGLIAKLTSFDLVIIGIHKSNEHPWKSYEFTDKELVWLQEISRKKNVILDLFASPYALSQLKSFSNIESIVVSYQNSVLAQELSAQLIFGAIQSRGKLPVSINKQFKEGDGLSSFLSNRLGYSIPEDVQLSSKKLGKIAHLVDTILEEKMAPGLQILVARHGKVVYQKSFGFHTDKKKQPVLNSDLYDVASLTKILTTLPLVMKAEDQGKLSLSTSIKKLLPEFKNSNKDTVTIKEILSHYGGLQSWIPFYKKTQDSITQKNLAQFYRSKRTKKYRLKVTENLFLKTSYQDSIYQLIKEAPQQDSISYKYSDLGYYILKKALEKIYRKPLNKLANDYFYKVLGADRTTFIPLSKFSKTEIVPSENDTYFRNQLIHGTVHDMGAAMLGGVGGHAGLFANANDIAKIMQLYLQNGYYGGKRFIKSTTIAKYNQRYYETKNVRRGVGFDKPQLNPKVKATCGCVSDKSFGHSGFTGTYTWADPESGILYVFLSNRTFPTMENIGLVTNDMRTKIQQIIQDAIQ